MHDTLAPKWFNEYENVRIARWHQTRALYVAVNALMKPRR